MKANICENTMPFLYVHFLGDLPEKIIQHEVGIPGAVSRIALVKGRAEVRWPH